MPPDAKGGSPPPPVPVEVLCGGGCGEKILLPEQMAIMVQEGQAEAPMCLRCLRVRKATRRRTRQRRSEPRQAPESEAPTGARPEARKDADKPPVPVKGAGIIPGGAPGPVPKHTTLVITRKHQRARKGHHGQVGFTIELHPSAEDKDMPQLQLLVYFARALGARIRQLRPPRDGKGPRGEGLGYRIPGIQAIPKPILDRARGIMGAVQTGAKVLSKLPRLRRGKRRGGK